MFRSKLRSALPALILLGLAGLLAAEDPSAPLAARLDEILARPSAQRATWGVLIADLDSGETLFAHDEDKLFVPASNAKVYATSLALSRLGPEMRFSTKLLADGALSNGVLRGDLVLVGGGDPNLSSRHLPYNPKIEFREDRLEPMRELARAAKAAGVTAVEGDVVGDATRYVWEPFPPGWSLEDVSWGYGAPVSALTFNDNTMDILVRPGSGAGQPAALKITPPLEYFNLRNLTRTAPSQTVARRLEMQLHFGQRRLDLWGQISQRSPGREMNVAVDDPALFAAMALHRALEEEGVKVKGAARGRYVETYDVGDLKAQSNPPAPPRGVEIASRESASLAAILQALNKDSLNLHAEMLLREVGYQRRNVGSVDAGIEEMRDFLQESGLSPWEFFLEDGSGLSRKNLVSPAGTVKLLRAMYGSEARAAWVDSLPIAGEDGTLDWRFSKTAARGRIHAKTGTLSHVTALAGYATALNGRELVFAVYVNNFGVSTSYIRNLVDLMLVEAVTAPDSPAIPAP
ncbi:MAG: D-alanyl-D-alanine carboxypeptidase/D-alanyl-D-alanine-endopeptidase [Acidobacteria bacterium]|nr:D-alanyl-D-alanine carboxypeptidase/D-alanyl-D-alanine-endopeptidase [Acidobacteriota bacterium]